MRQSIYLRLGVLAVVLATFFGLAPGSVAQTNTGKTYSFSLTVKSATVKSFTEEFTKKTGILFSYESALARKEMGDISINARNESLASILDDVFGHQVSGFRYKMTNSTVVLTYEQPAAKQGNVIKVTGTVKDSSGEPLAGAGVLVKGTTIGTNTNLDGKYSIEVNADDVLEYSFIGFKNHDEKVNGRGVIDVMISEDANVLDDVVVVGYGTQSRKTLTTAISKVDGNSIYAAPVSSVGDALKGKVTGLRVATNNTVSGNAPRFLIRGGSSITLSNDPIVIVDGVTRDMDDLTLTT